MARNFINDKDFENELLVAHVLKNYLRTTDPERVYRFIPSNHSLYARAFPITHPRHYHKNRRGEILPDPHDFDIWRDHLHIGVLEVKYRVSSTARYVYENGPFMGSIKIRNLEYYFVRRGFRVWFAWLCERDGGLILSEYRRWVHYGGESRIGNYEQTCKDNHGLGIKQHDPRDFVFPTPACTLIPNALNLFGGAE